MGSVHTEEAGTPGAHDARHHEQMPHMYIVRCRDGRYYTGSTLKEPEVRVWEHNNDEDYAARYTIKRRPVVLVYAESYLRIDDAFAREKQVQNWSRAKKEALIEGRLGDLPELARSSRNDASTGSATGRVDRIGQRMHRSYGTFSPGP